MMIEMHCPFCDTDFVGAEWRDGFCPTCQAEYYWAELPNDTDDPYAIDMWDKN